MVRKSLFLAGPTPRGEGFSWRAAAIKMLEKLGYDGHVFIPEPRSGRWEEQYDAQIEWEEEGLNRADIILFWIPRDLKGTTYGCAMPGLTTNDEFGVWKTSGKVVLGAPPMADSVRYQKHYANKYGILIRDTLMETLQAAVGRLGQGAERFDSECCIPLHLWVKPEFQRWYSSQLEAGHKLDGARILWSFWPKSNFMFSSIVHVSMDVAGENRKKTNEFVFTRTDVSAVVLYQPDRDEVALVREYRSPVRNDKGFVYELPGGSSPRPGENPLAVAAHEVEEETGLKLPHDRFRLVQERQLQATLSAHTGSLFIALLTKQEMDLLKADTSVHGVEEDTERTYVEVFKVAELLKLNIVDWATLGMIVKCVL